MDDQGYQLYLWIVQYINAYAPLVTLTKFDNSLDYYDVSLADALMSCQFGKMEVLLHANMLALQSNCLSIVALDNTIDPRRANQQTIRMGSRLLVLLLLLMSLILWQALILLAKKLITWLRFVNFYSKERNLYACVSVISNNDVNFVNLMESLSFFFIILIPYIMKMYPLLP